MTTSMIVNTEKAYLCRGVVGWNAEWKEHGFSFCYVEQKVLMGHSSGDD